MHILHISTPPPSQVIVRNLPRSSLSTYNLHPKPYILITRLQTPVRGQKQVFAIAGPDCLMCTEFTRELAHSRASPKP